MAVVAAGAYVLKLGSIWLVDARTITDLAVLAVVGLAVNEVTKYLNN